MSKFKPYYAMSKSPASEYQTLRVKKTGKHSYDVVSDGEVIFNVDYDEDARDYIVSSYGEPVSEKQAQRVLTHPVVMQALGLE